MYFPYLRGKLNELVLLDDCRGLLQINRNIIPIIEPVRVSLNNLTNKLSRYVENNIPIILISNPTVGELANNQNMIINQVLPQLNAIGSSHILGYIITERTTQQDILHFLQICQNNRICFIHEYEFSNPNILRHLNNLSYQIFIHNFVGTIYQQLFLGDNRVIIEDGFTPQPRNALYPNDENFLDINLSYSINGFIGFGDYLIVGRNYRENGGPAHAVVIHITYQKTNGEIGIRHFISDRTTTNIDIPGKFAEALEKLIREKNSKGTKLLSTDAMDIFQELHDTGYFPGLGSIKKLSMEHHIELISRII